MKLFENKTYTILPADEFKLFAGMQFPAPDSDLGKAIIANADEALQTDIPQLYASQYRRFAIDGNRSEYEAAYFDRRRLLKRLLLGELVEKSGRYTDKIIDIVWLMLEESSWIIPAHNKYEYYKDPHQIDAYPQLPRGFDGTVTFVDLFSAETGALLALVYHYLKDNLIASDTEIICNRILYTAKERVIAPFMRYDHMSWMGGNGHIPNNWNPWILSNILLITALTESETEQRQNITNRALRLLDNFLDVYNEDGGCNEGPHYWGEAAAALFDVFEILDDLTGGKADIFSHPLVYNMMDYIRKVHLTDNFFANFADSDPELYKDGFPNVIRMGQRTNNALLTDFAAKLTPQLLPFYCDYGHNYRTLKNVCTTLPKCEVYTPANFDVLPDLQLAVWRKGAFHIAIKGGHNNESHNHNDIGNIIVFCKNQPVLIDIGVPTYTRDLFSDKRYTVFPIASEYHNLPIVNGYTQKTGESYRADSFSADENGAKVTYTGAYKEESIRNCTRTIQMNDNVMTLREEIETDGDVYLQYFLPYPPKRIGENTFELQNAKISLPANAICTIEPVALTDQRISQNWHTGTLYKLIIKSTGKTDVTMQIQA